jgi:hypothetical protein
MVAIEGHRSAYRGSCHIVDVAGVMLGCDGKGRTATEVSDVEDSAGDD